MRLLTGGLTPDHGTARIAGHDTNLNPQAARAATGYLPEAAAGFSHLLPVELLIYVGEARGLDRIAARNEARRIEALLDMAPVRDRTLAALSKGWRQRVWLAQALVSDPPVLILDEPTDGLDPNQKDALRALLRRHSEGKAVLMSTHILEEAEALCDRVLVMNSGRIVADAPTVELQDKSGRLMPAFMRLTRQEALAS